MAEQVFQNSVKPVLRSLLMYVCGKQIDEMQETNPGIISVTATTSDGFTLATTLRLRADADKLSAMASSMGALGAALSQSAGRGGVDNLVMETAEGKIALMRVSGLKEQVVLAVVADASVNLGQLLWACRNACQKISEAAQAR